MANEGIMAAPMPMQQQQQQQQQPLQGYVSSLDAYNAASSAMQDTDPQAFGEYKSAIGSKLSALNLKPSEIEAFITLLEYIMQYPDQYKEVIRAGIEEGAIDEGDFPAEFDQGFISSLLAALNEQRIQQAQNVSPEAMGPGPQEPMAMKSGGLADAAKVLQSKGRNSDTMLAHINPQEAAMLRRAGGLGTINPHTGLPEYFSFKKLWKAVTAPARAVVNVAKDIASSPIGKIALTIGLTMALGPAGLNLGLGMAGTGAIVGGGMAALGGGNLQDVLKGAAMGYIGGTVAPSISGYMPGAAGSVLNQGLTGAAMGTGFGLATGMSLKDSLKAGAIGGVTAAGVGYGQQKGYIPGGKPVDLGYSPAEQARLEQMDPISLDDNLSINPIKGAGTAVDNLPPSTVDKYSPYYKGDAAPADNFTISQAQADQVASAPGYTPRLSAQSQYLMDTPTDYSLDTATSAPVDRQTLLNKTYGDFQATAPINSAVVAKNPSFVNDYSLEVRPIPSSGEPRPMSYDQTGRFGTDLGVQPSPAPSAMNNASAQFGTSAGGSDQQTAISMQDASVDQPRLTPQQIESYVTKPTAFESFTEGAKGLYNRASDAVVGGYDEYLSPSRPSMQQAEQNALLKADQAEADYMASSPKPTQRGADAAYKAAYDSNSPGFISKYLPLAAAGLGATYLAGGFEAPPSDDTPIYDPAYTGTEYMRDNPQLFSGSLYNYQSQGAGAYDPYRPTNYAVGQGPAPGVVTPTGSMQAQYSPNYGRRRMRALQQYYSPFIGTAEPVMAAKGGMVTAEPVYMVSGGYLARAVRGIKEPARIMGEEGRQALSKFVGAPPPMPADLERMPTDNANYQPPPPVSLIQQRYDPYRATIYAGNQGTASPGVVAPTGIMQAQYSPNYGRRRMRPVRAADGGSITEFPRKSGPINGPGTGTSDDIPAMLSDGEFVFTARAVRNAGDGSRRKGAARMYKLMKSLEKGGMVKG